MILNMIVMRERKSASSTPSTPSDPSTPSVSSAPCLTFESPNSFTIAASKRGKTWDGTLEFSTDAANWTVWDGTAEISSGEKEGGYVLYMRGAGNTVITGHSDEGWGPWVLTGSEIRCSGNIENLLDWETVQSGGHPAMADYCYACLFQDCAGLISAPELPAPTLTVWCYGAMFEGTGLTRAPALPATALADYCYADMFYNCVSLAQAPDLPADTLAEGCCEEMFWGCASLTQAPALPAATMAQECYFRMFGDCTSLTQAPDLPATTLAFLCYRQMFRNCTGLTRPPDLPAATLPEACYREMFSGCAKIKLSAVQTENYTEEYRIPKSGTGWDNTNSLTDMFEDTGGTFKGTPSINTTYYMDTSA